MTDSNEGLVQVTPVGWHITEPSGLYPWTAQHDDFDASYEGEEDGWVGNGLGCTANTREELLAEIEWIEAEHPHFATHKERQP